MMCIDFHGCRCACGQARDGESHIGLVERIHGELTSKLNLSTKFRFLSLETSLVWLKKPF